MDDVHGDDIRYDLGASERDSAVFLGYASLSFFQPVLFDPIGLRYVAVGRVKIAKTVLDMLPRGLSSMREPEDRAMEYMHYKQFFIVWEAVERVIQSQSVEVSHIDKESRLAWLEDYRVSFSHVLRDLAVLEARRI